MLDKLFTAKERKDHQWEIDDNARRGMVYKHKDEAHRLYNQLIIDEQEGRRLDIVFESKDGKYVPVFDKRHVRASRLLYFCTCRRRQVHRSSPTFTLASGLNR